MCALFAIFNYLRISQISRNWYKVCLYGVDPVIRLEVTILS